MYKISCVHLCVFGWNVIVGNHTLTMQIELKNKHAKYICKHMCLQRKLESRKKLSTLCTNYKLQIPFELKKSKTQKPQKAWNLTLKFKCTSICFVMGRNLEAKF